MEIRDPVHGSIKILEEEVDIIRHPFFQRLRNIKQLGFSDYIFPGATHTRFIHSIGVMHIGQKVFERLFGNFENNQNLKKLKETFKLACLLHDIGHAPLSHSTEIVMPSIEKLKLNKHFQSFNRKATHEDYTIKIITESSFADSLKMVSDSFEVSSARIAELIIGRTIDKKYFTINGICYFDLLHQLVSSELDCDRMDYLLRDSYFCGVSYGQFDLDWLIDNLRFVVDSNNNAILGITEKSVVTFDDFLLSRYHMFIMVYFHYRSVCLEQLLYKYFNTSNNEYTIPFNIEEYIEHDDHRLIKVMRKSKNKFANSIVNNKIPDKIYESFNAKQLITLKKIENILTNENVDFISCNSSSRLSKYYNTESSNLKDSEIPLQVVRTSQFESLKTFYSIHQATDLFTKFSKSHEINRIHCDLSQISQKLKDKIIRICV